MSGLLLNADGSIHNAVIEQHARAFTLDYLRHTILGTPRDMTSVPTQGPMLITDRQSPRILDPHEARLIIEPQSEEIEQFGAEPRKPAAPREALDEGFLLKRFQKHIGKATVGGIISSKLELLRTAISIQMERVLDATHAGDQEAFHAAYGELETTLTVGMSSLLPELKAMQVSDHDAQTVLKELMETSVSASIDKHVATIDNEKGRSAFIRCYEDLLDAYQEKQTQDGKMCSSSASTSQQR